MASASYETTSASGGLDQGATARVEPGVHVLHGPGILNELGEDFDALALRCGAPITARRLWLEAWIQSYRQYLPVAVGIGRPGEALAAVALFGVRRGRFGREVVCLGHGASDQSRVYALDADAARELAAAVRSWLLTLPRPWRMTLAQLPADDEAVRALGDVLTHSSRLPAPGSPMVVFNGDRSPDRYITPNYRGQAKNKWNRMVKHGLTPEIELLTSPEKIAGVLPRVLEIAGIRQQELTGRRQFDQPYQIAFFRRLVLDHAERGDAELMVLRIRGEIGAYSLTFRDGRTARMWSSHYHPQWSAYSPGHILSRALVERCLARPDIEVLDWMKGLEPYKLRTANHVQPAQSLRAWSGLAGRCAGTATEWLRTAARRARDRHPILRRFQVALRQRLGRSRLRAEPGGEAVVEA